jgi:hypothetical protein
MWPKGGTRRSILEPLLQNQEELDEELEFIDEDDREDDEMGQEILYLLSKSGNSDPDLLRNAANSVDLAGNAAKGPSLGSETPR